METSAKPNRLERIQLFLLLFYSFIGISSIGFALSLAIWKFPVGIALRNNENLPPQRVITYLPLVRFPEALTLAFQLMCLWLPQVSLVINCWFASSNPESASPRPIHQKGISIFTLFYGILILVVLLYLGQAFSNLGSDALDRLKSQNKAVATGYEQEVQAQINRMIQSALAFIAPLSALSVVTVSWACRTANAAKSTADTKPEPQPNGS
jgi:hypothetical protein